MQRFLFLRLFGDFYPVSIVREGRRLMENQIVGAAAYRSGVKTPTCGSNQAPVFTREFKYSIIVVLIILLGPNVKAQGLHLSHHGLVGNGWNLKGNSQLS